MNLIDRELEAIDATGALAWSYVEQGEWRKARRSLKKIRNSFCVTESDRLHVAINAEILSRQGRQEEAKSEIRKNLYSVWSYPEIWDCYNRQHAVVGEGTKQFVLSIKGSNTLVGSGHSLIGTIVLLANSEDEALSYLREIELYGDDMTIWRVSSSAMFPDAFLRRGIISCHPFVDASEYEEYFREFIC